VEDPSYDFDQMHKKALEKMKSFGDVQFQETPRDNKFEAVSNGLDSYKVISGKKMLKSLNILDKPGPLPISDMM
jgi:hypothetical protein